MLFILLTVVIVLCLLAFILNNKDLMEPSVIVCISYIISILCAVVNIKVWDINLANNTFWIITVGTVIFISINIIITYIIKSKYNKKYQWKQDLKVINIQYFKIILVAMFQIIVALFYAKSVRSLAGQYGSFNDFSSMMTVYRMNTSYGTNAGVSATLNQFVKLSNVCAFVFLYVFINNILEKSNQKRNLLNIIPVIIYSIQVILTGGRFNLLALICSAFIIYNVLWHRKNGWNRQIKIKFLFKAIIILIFVFVGFYFLKTFVGRTSKVDFITYITSYVGGSIQLFNMYVNGPISKSSIWGKETFYSINDFLRKVGLLNINAYIPHLEFRFSNGVMLGNVYTAYRRYIQDFGIEGMIILQSVFALFYSIFYEKIKLKFPKKKLDYSLLVYAAISYPLFMHSINDCFFSGILSVNYLIIIILLKLVSWFIVDIKVSFKNSLNRK
ncbi:oligosaccharide repeat unit polymerase [Clostridium tyrobutyricum]|uniref:O-antigen polymerase n=1 Tax=Clostridium tyrobutyricum TaxID=1519 RepID=UPI001C391A57|nr:O-antigen polymerase [Clostridium tyrobutyricum]MBV4420079.1 oligosaccharide repeat unit polymerase [Clostridium tyrobutyricum]